MSIGSGGADSEEGRAFLQDRLSLFGRWVFLISGSFLVLGTAVRVALGVPLSPATSFHVLGTLIAGAIWVTARSGRLAVPTIEMLDAVGTLLISVAFSLRVLGYARSLVSSEGDVAPAFNVGLLVCGYVLISRAIAMPSTPLRTLAIGAGAMVPLLASDVFFVATDTMSSAGAVVGLDVAMWAVAAVAMSAVTSHVIFGLRAEVSKIRRLGQYTLERKIGEGGMGAVYRARHAFLRRPTAIKLLPPDKAGEDNIRRFEREVQLTASLTHPNTVAIFDYGRTSGGVFYFAMEYLDGINLDELVRFDGAQPAGRVIHILEQVSGALAEAQGIGLIHRDVKPANIILCERGGQPDVAKVVDFGLVKPVDVSPADPTMTATSSNTIVGTPLYMAPEAMTGDGTMDARGDLYALGAVAYFLLTGTPVFRGNTVIEVCAQHLSSMPEPPSARLGRPIPADLEHLVLQCLAKSPVDRPQSATALQLALAGLTVHGSWSTADAARWWSRYRQTRAAEVRPPASDTVETVAADLEGRLASNDR
ncbi:MAG: serine/threonine protein kinase [Acidobacteriota bacterium]|nr:serine/threonine protein kinase [Acidobacteriota bacterium]